MDDEDRQIRLLQTQILGNQTRIRQTKHPGGHGGGSMIKLENGVSSTGCSTAVRPTIIKHNQNREFTITNAGRKKPSTETVSEKQIRNIQ